MRAADPLPRSRVDRSKRVRTSWSRYPAQLAAWRDAQVGPEWRADADAILDLVRRGDAVERLMQVTGDEGVTLEDFVVREKARLVDEVYLQQDGFDAVDRAITLERGAARLRLLRRVVDAPGSFADKARAREHFARLADAFRNLNYAPSGSSEESARLAEIDLDARLVRDGSYAFVEGRSHNARG